MLSTEQLDDALKVALTAAQLAADIINEALDNKNSGSVNFEEKSSAADVVTMYDKMCEEKVLEYLSKATPNYAVVSEETRNRESFTSAPTWVVDPIDGTMSFVHGMYDCCVSVGLLVNRESVLGVVHAPRIHEVFSAVKGKGAYCNGKRISVSSTSTLKKAIIFSHYSSVRRSKAVDSILNIHRELNLLPVHSIRCHGAGALDMCSVACGRADVYFDTETHPWDVAAATVIVREAGGVVHDVDDASKFDITSRGMCCGNHLSLSAPVVQLIRRYGYREAVLNKL